MQISLKLKPSWEIVKLTEKHPSVSLMLWCNFNVDFFQLRSKNEAELKPAIVAFLKTRRKIGSVLQKKIDLGSNAAAFIMKCNHPRRDSVEDIMYKSSCLPLPPFLYQNGWFRLNTICFDEDKITNMISRLGRLGEVKIEDKKKVSLELLRENFLIPTSALVSNLTAKQAEALLVAVEQGYYHVPRRTKFEDISKKVSVPRTTYEEHVRKAEGKVINSVAPYLSLFFGGTEKRASSM